MIRVDRYDFRATAGSLLARWKGMESSDDRAEKRVIGARRLARWAGWCCVGCILTAHVILASGRAGGYLAFMAAFLAVLVVAIILRGYAWYQERRYDLDDRKLAFLPGVLKVLRADIPAAEPVSAAVDFRLFHEPGRVDREWLTLGARLADGSRLRLSVTERGKVKRKYKRRGTLERGRLWERLTLMARVAEHHGGVEQAARRLKRVKPPAPLKLARAAWRQGVVRADLDAPVWRYSNSHNFTSKVPLTPAHVLSSLVWFYGALRPNGGRGR